MAVMMVNMTKKGGCAPVGYGTSRCLGPRRAGHSKEVTHRGEATLKKGGLGGSSGETLFMRYD